MNADPRGLKLVDLRRGSGSGDRLGVEGTDGMDDIPARFLHELIDVVGAGEEADVTTSVLLDPPSGNEHSRRRMGLVNHTFSGDQDSPENHR